jgi:hypothetical protein
METNLLGRRSPAFPTTVGIARTLSRSVMADRAAKVTWRAISEKMSITRIEAMKLGYSLDEVITEIKTAKAAR